MSGYCLGDESLTAFRINHASICTAVSNTPTVTNSLINFVYIKRRPAEDRDPHRASLASPSLVLLAVGGRLRSTHPSSPANRKAARTPRRPPPDSRSITLEMPSTEHGSVTVTMINRRWSSRWYAIGMGMKVLTRAHGRRRQLPGVKYRRRLSPILTAADREAPFGGVPIPGVEIP
jgi:hypothetical protein